MARWLHFDLVGGASGDMCLGALIDLGVSADKLQSALEQLPIEPVRLQVESDVDQGLHGTRVTVQTRESSDPHGTPVPDGQAAHAPHRHLKDIRAIIEAADLPAQVKAQSLAVFTRIGVAEAKIHDTSLDHIHFHEVGALDSIADIVGSCLALHWLAVDGVSVSAILAGHGVIQCAHGTYPNPAPATLEILRGLPVTHVDEPHELVTPTGAALLAEWRQQAVPAAGQHVQQVGYGLGHHRLTHRPNVLRATLYETAAADATPDRCLVLECNLDDTTPEIIGHLTDTLRAHGALDVYTTPVHMKKQRPGVLLTVLGREQDRDLLLQCLFAESTTFGVRETVVQRHLLDRSTEEVETPYGAVRVKVGRWQGRVVTRTPEFADCQARAAAAQVPVREVWVAAQSSAT